MNYYNSMNIYQTFKLGKEKKMKKVQIEVVDYMIKNAENGVLMVEKCNFNEQLVRVLE